jgi:hypothetical protein
MPEDNNKTPWQKYKENLGETRPWDILNPKTEYADKSVYDERYSICVACPHFVKLTNQCKKCGCFMSLKTKLKDSICPIGKWGLENDV